MVRHIIKAALVATLPVALSVGGIAQPAPERIDVVAVGIYDLEIVARSGSDLGPADVGNTIAKVRRIANTSSVPMQLCVSFGFEYVIAGSPAGELLPLRMITRFPPPGLRNPHTGHLSLESEIVVPRVIGRRHYRTYTLEHDWELLPGQWSFEIWHGQRKLAAQAFWLEGPCRGNCRSRDDHELCAKLPVSSRVDRAFATAALCLAAPPLSCPRALQCVRIEPLPFTGRTDPCAGS